MSNHHNILPCKGKLYVQQKDVYGQWKERNRRSH